MKEARDREKSSEENGEEEEKKEAVTATVADRKDKEKYKQLDGNNTSRRYY